MALNSGHSSESGSADLLINVPLERLKTSMKNYGKWLEECVSTLNFVASICKDTQERVYPKHNTAPSDTIS